MRTFSVIVWPSVALALLFLACTERVEIGSGGPTSDEAGPPAPTPADASPDARVADAPPAPDASVDASPDASVDAPPDATALGLRPRTLADLPGLGDFDFTDTTLVVRVGQGFATCPLSACTTPTPIPNTAGHNGRFSVAGNELYFSAPAPSSIQDNVFSVAFDGTNRQNRTNHAVPGTLTESFLGVASFGGGLTNVEQIVTWARTGDAGYRTLVQVTAGASGNPHRVGRATANVHENAGSLVRYLPEQMRFVVTENNPGRLITPAEMTVTGAALPLPATSPSAIASSPRGAGVLHPMVVIREAGTLKACPTSTDCPAWIDLGALGDVFTLDATNLYVGGAFGLGRCALEEIATRGTCTLKAMDTRAAVQAPMYLTDGEVFYRSASRVHAASKLLDVSCPPGTPGASCAVCAAGERPVPASSACEACPRGHYAVAAGSLECTACPDDTSTATTGARSPAACTPCPAGETANAGNEHVCGVRLRRVFLTAESHDGDFGGDATLPGATPLAKADAFCMQSSAKPRPATYKAFMADGTLRDGATLVDWVLAPSAKYVQADGVTPIVTTTASAALVFPLENPWVTGASANFWTGMTSTAGASMLTRSCQGWTAGSSSHAGNMGYPNRTNTTAVGVGVGATCQNRLRVLCVEQ